MPCMRPSRTNDERGGKKQRLNPTTPPPHHLPRQTPPTPVFLRRNYRKHPSKMTETAGSGPEVVRVSRPGFQLFQGIFFIGFV